MKESYNSVLSGFVVIEVGIHKEDNSKECACAEMPYIPGFRGCLKG